MHPSRSDLQHQEANAVENALRGNYYYYCCSIEALPARSAYGKHGGGEGRDCRKSRVNIYCTKRNTHTAKKKNRSVYTPCIDKNRSWSRTEAHNLFICNDIINNTIRCTQSSAENIAEVVVGWGIRGGPPCGRK